MTPLPRNIGSYKILEPLGTGGMGVVYRAQHAVTGQLAALKTVRVPQGWMLQGIRREIRALARIRHPGIVRILEEGIHDGLPWYAMELVEGVTLHAYGTARSESSLLSRATAAPASHTAVTVDPDTPSALLAASAATAGPDTEIKLSAQQPTDPGQGVPLLETLGVLRRLCAALAFLHGEGIVHRDLKPGNILVTPEGLPVIVDFGLMAQFGGEQSREELAIAGEMVGTAAYMAPEQILGDFVDARADLYALGCILYELVTGRPPFLASSRGAVGHAHLHSEPVPPSVLVRGLPPQLEALILRLLAKHPRRRLGHANDVAAVLAELGADLGPAAPEGPTPRAYLYRPGLAGRLETLERFEQKLDALEAGRGCILLAGGESGSGKTRLAMELARKARLRKLPVLAGECLSAAIPEALGALRQPLQAIADRCRENGPEETERLLGQRGQVLAAYVPELSAVPGLENHPQPPPLPAGAARLRLYTALTDTLAAVAQLQPLLLILDDLQWADELTVGWLEYLVRATAGGSLPLMVLATYRSEDVGAPGKAPLQALLALDGPERFELERLDERAVGSMVGDMLAMTPAPAVFVGFLAQHSEGNPFFVAEYLRAAVAEGLLFRDLQGRWQIADPAGTVEPQDFAALLPLPRSLRELVGRRLDGLPPLARHLVEAASVAGRETDVLLVWEISRLDDEELLDSLDHLLRRQVLETSAPGRLRFLHDKIREVALEAIPADRRAQLHRSVAGALEARPDAEREEHLAALALHWEMAGVPEKAAPYALAGARRAAKRFTHAEAERLFRAYFRLAPSSTEASIRAHCELSMDVLRITGRGREAAEELQQALAEVLRLPEGDSPRQVLEGLVLLHLATLYQEQGQPEEARQVGERALLIARASGQQRNEILLLGLLAIVEREQGRPEASRALYEQALAMARAREDRLLEATQLGNLAVLCYELGNLEETRSLQEQALVLLRSIGNRRFEAVTLSNLAFFHYEAGRLQQAQTLFAQALELHRASGDRRSESYSLSSLGLLAADEGRIDEAMEIWSRALAVQHDSGDRASEGATLVRLATLERRRGALGQAEHVFRQAETILRKGNYASDVLLCLCGLGHTALARQEDASGFLAEAESIVSTLRVSPESGLQKAVDRLRAAIEDDQAGKPLLHGERPEDIPELLRLALPSRRPLRPRS